jgi:hypothetical protein
VICGEDSYALLMGASSGNGHRPAGPFSGQDGEGESLTQDCHGQLRQTESQSEACTS